MTTDKVRANVKEKKQKPYETPRIIRYGTVNEITQSGGSTQPDAHQARQHHPGQGGGPP